MVDTLEDYLPKVDASEQQSSAAAADASADEYAGDSEIVARAPSTGTLPLGDDEEDDFKPTESEATSHHEPTEDPFEELGTSSSPQADVVDDEPELEPEVDVLASVAAEGADSFGAAHDDQPDPFAQLAQDSLLMPSAAPTADDAFVADETIHAADDSTQDAHEADAFEDDQAAESHEYTAAEDDDLVPAPADSSPPLRRSTGIVNIQPLESPSRTGQSEEAPAAELDIAEVSSPNSEKRVRFAAPLSETHYVETAPSVDSDVHEQDFEPDLLDQVLQAAASHSNNLLDEFETAGFEDRHEGEHEHDHSYEEELRDEESQSEQHGDEEDSGAHEDFADEQALSHDEDNHEDDADAAHNQEPDGDDHYQDEQEYDEQYDEGHDEDQQHDQADQGDGLGWDDADVPDDELNDVDGEEQQYHEQEEHDADQQTDEYYAEVQEVHQYEGDDQGEYYEEEHNEQYGFEQNGVDGASEGLDEYGAHHADMEYTDDLLAFDDMGAQDEQQPKFDQFGNVDLLSAELPAGDGHAADEFYDL